MSVTQDVQKLYPKLEIYLDLETDLDMQPRSIYSEDIPVYHKGSW